MERMTNEDIEKGKSRKFMTESKRAVSRIGKDDKVDLSKVKLRPSDNDKSLAAAIRFRMDLPSSMSDSEVLKMYRQKGITNKKIKKEKTMNNPRMSDQDLKMMQGLSDRDASVMFGKKAGGTKVEKKSIMELPTNVPRLMRGALLGDLDKDGKMSGYETARQNAIEKSMKEQKTKKAKSGLAVGIAKIKSK